MPHAVPYPEPDVSSEHTSALFALRSTLMLSPCLCLGLPDGSFLKVSTPKTACISLPSPLPPSGVTCNALAI